MSLRDLVYSIMEESFRDRFNKLLPSVERGFEDADQAVFALNYFEKAIAFDMLPIAIPALDPSEADAFLDLVDGLIFTGGTDIDPTLYVPLTGGSAVFEVRTTANPSGLITPIRNLINQQDSNLPMTGVKTQAQHIAALLAQERILAQLSSFFGALALVLACVGLYGLLSYEVSRRTREIGIRMALGARRLSLIRLIVWQGAALALVGTAAGVAAALGIGKLLTKLLYGVKPSDPVTLVVVTVLLLVVALAAAFTPARRATTVDPMVALRYE